MWGVYFRYCIPFLLLHNKLPQMQWLEAIQCLISHSPWLGSLLGSHQLVFKGSGRAGLRLRLGIPFQAPVLVGRNQFLAAVELMETEGEGLVLKRGRTLSRVHLVSSPTQNTLHLTASVSSEWEPNHGSLSQ